MTPIPANLTLRRGGGTRCNECDRVVPAAQPVALVSDPAGEVLWLGHRTCIAGAVRLAQERPGQLDLVVAFIDDAGRN